MINQILPNYISTKILHYFDHGESKEDIGFKTYYNKCYFTGIKNILKKNEFKIIEIKDYHYSSEYFTFFLPLFLLSCLYEISTNSFKNLASYLLIIAQKKA